MQRQLGSRTRLAALSALMLFAGCQNHPENYRWSDKAPPTFGGSPATPPNSPFGKDWSKPAVSVYSFTTPAPAASDAGLRDLSDRGQAALITAMTAPGAKPDDIRGALSKPLKASSEPGEDAVTVEGSFKRTLVANVTKGWDAVPGERLVWTWIVVEPINFVFDGYTVVATDNQVLNIEQVTNATTAGVTGNLGKTGSETSATTTTGSPISNVLTNVAGSSAGVSGSLSNTYTTTASINQQYMKLGVDIMPSQMRIYRESERNLDVSGNTLISLTMRLDPSKWRGVGLERTQRVTKLDLAKPDGTLAGPSEIVFEVTQNKAPPRCALTAKVTLYYQVRKPRNGRSYVEGEQEADYTKGTYDAGEVTIVPADEVRKLSWRLYPQAQPDAALQLISPFGYNNPLEFTSYEQAQNFALWLMQHGTDFFGKMDPPIGKGLKLSTGILGQPLFAGPYFVERTKDPENLQALCAGMATVPPAPAQANPAQKPVTPPVTH